MSQLEQVLSLLAESGNLTKACREVGVAKSTFLDWVARDAANADRYAHAREAGLDAEADRAIEEATTWDDDPALGRLALDARKWYLSKLMPKKYGDKTLVGSDPDNPLPSSQINVSGLSEATLRELARVKVGGEG